MQVHIFLLLHMAFILLHGAQAGEIIGGWKARAHSRPYMAYLQVKRADVNYRCGGFLVSKDFVLTAAHCTGDNITVILGAHNIGKKERNQQQICVHDQIPHPEYNMKLHNNDIMLLKLAQNAKLNKWVNTIRLPHSDEILKPGTKCSVAGWGTTGCGPLPHTLQEVKVKVLEDAACPRRSNGPYCFYNPSTMLCVGDPKKGKDSSQGDSGGPLVCGRIAQGIVSWGPCCPPGVYTKISTFIPWIQENMVKLQP